MVNAGELREDVVEPETALYENRACFAIVFAAFAFAGVVVGFFMGLLAGAMMWR